MKTKSLLAISTMALVMAACSSDDEMNNAGVTQDNEGAVVTLKLDMSNPQTKGNPDATNDQEGSPEENAIDNVTVVVKYADETKIFKDDDNGVTWTKDSKTFKFETPAGDATFYVYANVNAADNLSPNWSSDLVSKATDVSAYYTDNAFFMSNQNGEGVEHTINADTENNITVNIERAAAKVTVESKDDFSGPENPFGGKLWDMHFALGNMVSNFYLLQQNPISIPTTGLTYLPENDQTGDDDWTEVVLNQSASGVSSTELVRFNAAYCMENVQSEYKQNNTTYIKFSTVFTPDKALDFNTTGGGDWTVKGTLKDVTEPLSAADASSFFVVLDGNAEYTSNYILKSDLYDGNQAKTGLTITEIDGGYSITGIEGITKISDEYKGGKCFFGPIWVNLTDDGSLSPIYRNDWYHLTVNSIKLPGLPSEPGDGGEIPLTPNVDVTITLSVLDWNLVNRDIDLQ